MHCVTPVCLQTLLAPTRRVTRPADKALLVDNLNVSHNLKCRSPHRQNIFSGGLKRKFININVTRPTGKVAPPARCFDKRCEINVDKGDSNISAAGHISQPDARRVAAPARREKKVCNGCTLFFVTHIRFKPF